MSETKQENKPAPVFHIVGQYAKDVSLECPKPAFLIEKTDELSVAMDVGLTAKPLGHNDLHEVVLRFRGEGKNKEGQSHYLVEVDYAAVFQIQNIPAEQISPLLSIDGAALIFPFARQLFMDCVQQAGYRTPIVEPINFHALYVQAQKEQQEKQAS